VVINVLCPSGISITAAKDRYNASLYWINPLQHGKNRFVTATKLGTTNKIFVAATKNFAAATKRFVDITKHVLL